MIVGVELRLRVGNWRLNMFKYLNKLIGANKDVTWIYALLWDLEK